MYVALDQQLDHIVTHIIIFDNDSTLFCVSTLIYSKFGFSTLLSSLYSFHILLIIILMGEKWYLNQFLFIFFQLLVMLNLFLSSSFLHRDVSSNTFQLSQAKFAVQKLSLLSQQDISAVKNLYSSYSGSDQSLPLPWAAHNLLELRLQRIQCPLLASTYSCTDEHTLTPGKHDYTIKINLYNSGYVSLLRYQFVSI